MYDEVLEWLYGLEVARGWDLKLERVRSALTALGSPERRYPTVLVAGTNGKGSTVAMVHSIAQAAGLRSGLYTSPHLVHFTERIRIDRSEIGREAVVEGVARIRRCMESRDIPLTFFEVATVLAFHHFAESSVDLAILEVGLGGRLDATNVSEPCVSAVTSIGFDHQEFLGTTLAEIAREKAGVMRAGRPVILGEGMPPEAGRALHTEAGRVGARVVEARDVELATPATGPPGAPMRCNPSVAAALVAALQTSLATQRLTSAAVAAGLASASWPGRLAVVARDPEILCDGAHNLEAARALIATLADERPGVRFRLLFGALRDKPWREILALLAPWISSAVMVPVGGARGVDAAGLAAEGTRLVPTRSARDVPQALEWLRAESHQEPILATGSLYLVGEVYRDVLTRHGLSSVFDLDGAW